MEERRPASISRDESIPLLEEEARVAKRTVQTGRVRVRTTTDIVEEIARATLDEDVVDVTRIPVGREVNEPPAVRTEDGVVIVPVLEEVLVVEKRLVLREELQHPTLRFS
jgi:stress response protein YsnF